MKPRPALTLALCLVPAIVMSLLYYSFLGHRRDYLGHFAAGYGGTLGALAALLAFASPLQFARMAPWVVIGGTLLCIGLGTITEATIFRIAKFDEIDYSNQNLGAILAGLGVTSFCVSTKPTYLELACAVIVGFLFLRIGVYFAFT